MLHFSIFPLFHILCLSAAAKCHGAISWLSVISLTAHNLHVDGKGYSGHTILHTDTDADADAHADIDTR